MKEKHFQTHPARERCPAFGPNTGSEPGHDTWPDAPHASLESAPASASDRGLDGGLGRDPGIGTGNGAGFAHGPWAAEQGKPGLGPGSLESSALTRRQLYAEALKACHLEKRRSFREFVRGADPERDAMPVIRPVPDDQPRSHGRGSRYPSPGRRPPKASAARLLDYLQGDSWQSDAPRSLEPEREEPERPSTLEGEVKPKPQADALAPSEPHRNIQDRAAPSLNFESQLKEEAPRVTRALGREPQAPALLNFESLIEAKAKENAPDTETEAKAKAEAEAETKSKTKEAAPGPESARKSDPQPSALARDCEPRGDGSDGNGAIKARPAPDQGETTRGEDRHPRGLALFFAPCKRLVRKFF